MDRGKVKEAGRRKLIRDKADTLKEKTPRKVPASAVMKQAGRYRAIEAARKHLSEAQQAVVPDQDQEPYTAVDKVEAYAVNTAHELIPTHYHSPHVQRENVSHGETHFPDPQHAKTPTPQERMRRQMVQEIKKQKSEASRNQSRNLSHGETSFADDSQLPETPQEELRQSHAQRARRQQKASRRSGNELSAKQITDDSSHSDQRGKGAYYLSKGTEKRRQITGQRQRSLSRYASSAGAAKAQLVKEQGRRYARDQAIKGIKSGSAKGAAKVGSDFFQKVGTAITKAVRPSSDDLMLYGGFALVLIIPLIMLAGIAVALFGTGEGRSSHVPVSTEVEAYAPLIQLYANEYGIPEYTELIKAVMMQESGGQGTDPMQCSESGFNTRYPHVPNSITDPEYSIDVGVQSLAYVLELANAESPIDLERISLALQGYNYGSGYITWALANYGGYSELNAIEFSDMMAARMGWAGYGDKAYVSHVLRYYPIGRIIMGEGSLIC